jgi:flagellin
MGLRIRTNVQSLVAQRNLQLTQERAGVHMRRLASGHRISKAADDAAGLAISENLNADIRSLRQSQRNANDGVSLLQVAEGGLEEITNIIVRLKEISIQSASDTIGNREREYLNREFMALKDEVERIALATEFNGNRLLIGNKEVGPELLQNHNKPPLEIQVGKEYFVAQDALNNPNPINIIRIDFSKMNASIEGEGSLNLGSSVNQDGVRVDTKTEAQRAIAQIDDALQKVASYRADIGAIQNRLTSADKNLSNQIENLSAANSRIKDADFALDTAEFTQANILSQAGASVLAQANQMPQIALKLLEAL